MTARPFLLLLLASAAWCSPGDRQPQFQSCVTQCASSGCVGVECVPSCTIGDRSMLAASLRLLRWDCKARHAWRLRCAACQRLRYDRKQADCRYRCMHALEQARTVAGLLPLKYDGKWPFVRFLGMQVCNTQLERAVCAYPHA